MKRMTRVRKPVIERMESRNMFANIRPIVPITPIDQYDIKTGVDAAGATYEMKKLKSSDSATLTRCIGGSCEYISSVQDFTISGDAVDVLFSDGTTVRTFVRGDVSQLIANAAAAENNVPNPPQVGGIRGIIGNVSSEPAIAREYGSLAPRTLLDSIGRIEEITPLDTPDSRQTRGTGTILSFGGQRYVLTAAHVVETSSGVQRRPDEFQFVVQAGRTPSGRIDDGEVYYVEDIVGRSYFQTDLALLKLKKPVSNVYGAYLPDYLPQVGQQIIMAGYGYNNSNTVGIRNFGYSKIDGRDTLTDVKVDHFKANGVHLKYVYNQGEAAFAKGDSGGPDFIPQLIDGKWIPRLVGVHSFIDAGPDEVAPDVGESQWSVALTDTLVRKITDFIPYSVTAFIQFGIHIYEDGDSNISGGGEWRETFTVNGRGYDLIGPDFPTVYDGHEYWMSRIAIGSNTSIRINFTAYEQDDGFFTGDDDPVVPYSKTIIIAPELLKSEYTGKSGVLANSDTSYELRWKIFRDWAIVQRTTPVPTVRGATSFAPGAIPENNPSKAHWRNAAMPADTNGDGSVTPIDALLVINALNRFGSGTLRTTSADDVLYGMIDSSGDGSFSSIDALLVINHLNTTSPAPSLEAEGEWTGEGIRRSQRRR